VALWHSQTGRHFQHAMAHRPSRFLLREIERVGAAGALALLHRGWHRGEAKQTKGDHRKHDNMHGVYQTSP
tara:strand:- start:417 stop:629 length:213 start_codon:yes stop_codon:yes gene_type:complete